MSDDVVDIRKRIEEMRNEVSAAIVSGREQDQAARAAQRARPCWSASPFGSPLGFSRSNSDGKPINALTYWDTELKGFGLGVYRS